MNGNRESVTPCKIGEMKDLYGVSIYNNETPNNLS